jgi:hypothetical protein
LGFIGSSNAQFLDSTWGVTCFTNKFDPTFSFKSNSIDTCVTSIDIKVTYKGKPTYAYWSDGLTAIDRTINYSGTFQLYLFDSANCVDSTVKLQVILKGGTIYTYTDNGSKEVTICEGNSTYLYAYHNEEIVWNTGETSSNILVSKAGKYFAKTKSSKSCVTVSDTITVKVVTPKRLSVKVTGKSNFCFGDSCILEVNTTDSNIYWFPYYNYGKKIVAKQSGIYTVYYKDPTYGCGIYSDSVLVNVKTPEVFSICMVTNDSATGKNKVVWKPQSWVTKYKIYRESNISGEFDLLAELKGASNEFYLDTTSKPRTRAYTYYVDAVDSCGNIAFENQYFRHTTLHLTASLGVTGENNLNWSDYWGTFPISTYNIYRSNEGGAFKKIASVSASVKSFSDYEAPKGTNRYRIGIDAVTDCNSAKEELNSNIVAFGILADEDFTLNALSLSPNPAKNAVRINGLSGLNTVKIFNLAGKLVQETKVIDDSDFSIELLASGLYMVQVENKGVFKLIKE